MLAHTSLSIPGRSCTFRGTCIRYNVLESMCIHRNNSRDARHLHHRDVHRSHCMEDMDQRCYGSTQHGGHDPSILAHVPNHSR